MRGVVQRVDQACVRVEGQAIGKIGSGLLVFISVEKGDALRDCEYFARKILNMRVFSDDVGKMNHSVLEEKGQILAVSQFTLHGDCRKGSRPGFNLAESPRRAQIFFGETLELLRQSGLLVSTGEFGANMVVSSINAGPVTILLDSRRQF